MANETVEGLKRVSWLPDRDANINGALIGGQDYSDVEFIGGIISNVTLSGIDIEADQINAESVFIDPNPASGQVPDSSAPVQLLSSFHGAYNFDLEDPLTVPGRIYLIKKTDVSNNIITIRIQGDTSNGPDGGNYILNRKNDWIIVYSNGADWLTFSSNQIAQSAVFFDSDVSGASFALNAAVYFNLVDATTAAVTVTMPNPSDAKSIGKTVVIKRNNSGAHAVTINNVERGNNITLSNQDDYIMLFSNGADWWITSERR